MRFLLVLLAIVSGLSLADVAVAASPAEVVGVAALAEAAAAPAAVACPVQRARARARVHQAVSRPLSPGDTGFARSCGVTISDRPHE